MHTSRHWYRHRKHGTIWTHQPPDKSSHQTVPERDGKKTSTQQSKVEAERGRTRALQSAQMEGLRVENGEQEIALREGTERNKMTKKTR